MQQRLGRRLWAATLTGIPFGVFKAAAGWHLHTGPAPVLGAAFVIWGVLDIALNLLSIPLPRAVAHCVLSNAGRRIDQKRGQQRGAGRSGAAPGRHAWEHVGLALDTLLAFSIVAAMIGFDRLGQLPPALLEAWNLAVIANVLGVGVERMWAALRARRREAGDAPAAAGQLPASLASAQAGGKAQTGGTAQAGTRLAAPPVAEPTVE